MTTRTALAVHIHPVQRSVDALAVVPVGGLLVPISDLQERIPALISSQVSLQGLSDAYSVGPCVPRPTISIATRIAMGGPRVSLGDERG